MKSYASAILVLATVCAGLLYPDPTLANWWIVRSSDEKCLVVDIEPVPGTEGITRLGMESYSTEQAAESDLKRLCTDSAVSR